MDAGSSSEEKQRICAILSMGSDCYAVHIVDIVSEDGAAADDDVGIVDLNHVDTYRCARQFVERAPNILFQDFTDTDCLCGLGSTIFMFEGVCSLELKFNHIGGDDLSQRVGIYSFPLSAELMVMTARDEPAPCYQKSQLRKDSDMLGLKCAPLAVQYSSSSIIIFSTEIEYFNNTDARVVDFEIYNTESKLSVKLPPLHIGRLSATIFMLVDLVRDQRYYFTPKYNIEEYHGRGGEWRSSFAIRAYTFLGDHMFVVEPDFGGVRFSLDLASDSENQKWELFGVPMFFPSHYQHFITRNNLVLSSYGAHKVGYDGYESSAVFPFPLCSFVFPRLDRKNSSIILLEHSTYPELVACIVQVGMDDSERPFWTMDVVKLNDCMFEDRNKDGQFARRIKSFKFVFLCNFVSSSIVGLFAF